MEQNANPIGMIDSGVGGLTVLKELAELLPNNAIIYLGDNANCPYGNRPEQEILALTRRMLDFMVKKDVRLVAIACNTISSLVEVLQPEYSIPLYSIIEPAAAYIAASGIRQVGVIATEFTVRSRLYDKLIHRHNPQVEVYSQGSRTLASLVDSGRFGGEEIRNEVNACVQALLQQHPVSHIVLGCTHFPVVADYFQQAAPAVTWIDPAVSLAEKIRADLSQPGMSGQGFAAPISICTTGDVAVYRDMLEHLSISRASVLQTVSLSPLPPQPQPV